MIWVYVDKIKMENVSLKSQPIEVQRIGIPAHRILKVEPYWQHQTEPEMSVIWLDSQDDNRNYIPVRGTVDEVIQIIESQVPSLDWRLRNLSEEARSENYANAQQRPTKPESGE